MLELQPVRTTAPGRPQSPTPIGEATTSVVELPVPPARTAEIPVPPAKTTEIPIPPAKTTEIPIPPEQDDGDPDPARTKTTEIPIPPDKTTEIPIPQPQVAGPSVGQTSVTRVPTAVHAIDAVVVSIGRAPENTVVLNDLLVSRRHALLRRSGPNGNCWTTTAPTAPTSTATASPARADIGQRQTHQRRPGTVDQTLPAVPGRTAPAASTPATKNRVMQTLRTLADDGRSIVVVTHNIAHLNMCDRLLVLAPGGRLASFGPPPTSPALLPLHRLR